METTKTAEEIYLDLLRIDQHAKQIKDIVPKGGLSIDIDVYDMTLSVIFDYLTNKGMKCEWTVLWAFEIQLENILIKIY